jgi:outer membrane protein OmpA-like peptidoglycan-associated protein
MSNCECFTGVCPPRYAFWHPWLMMICFCGIITPAMMLHAQSDVLLTGSREITVGDKGFIAWRFPNFESVQVVGDTISAIRSARDMITIQPTRTTTYKLTALRLGGRRFDTVWRVVVLSQAQTDSLARLEASQQALSTGAKPSLTASSNTSSEIPPSVYLVAQANTTPSEYLAGIRRSGKAFQDAVRLKIVRIPDHSIEGSIIHAVVQDKFGNFLPSFAIQKSVFACSLLGLPDTLGNSANTTRNAPISSADPAFEVRETSLYDSRDLAFTLCADNAGYMKRFPQTTTVCREFMTSLGGRVEQNTILFDHRILINEKDTSVAAKNINGLTALYKGVYKGVLTLKQSGRRHKALVVVSGGKDDASLLYTIQDVMRSAREFGVVIYTVAVGSNADTYALRQMADYSGGRFYTVNDEKPEELSAVLKEIALSYKAFYEITFTGGTSVQAHSKVIDVTLSFKAGDNRTLSETKPFAMSEQAYYSSHQIVATFAPNSFAPDTQYEAQIASLAQVLRDNPDKIIELVGHTDMQGNDGANRSFALRRAQAVKQRLVAMNADPAQIRLRSAGREKPVYYFESEEWQARVNRRVELRWLDPSLVPYEILAEAVVSEEEAIRLETQWSARGYDAYYDTFLINRIPAYRLKLWGFATLESAEKTKTALQTKYKTPLKVQ